MSPSDILSGCGLPEPQEFTHADPARFERARCAIARDLFCRRTYLLRLILWITPKGHPWATVLESAYEDFRELTYATLRPRNKQGEVVPKMNGGPRPVRWASALYTILSLFVVYAIVSRLVYDIPSIVPLFTDNALFD